MSTDDYFYPYYMGNVDLLPDNFEWNDNYFNEYLWDSEDDMYDAYFRFNKPNGKKFSNSRNEMNALLKKTSHNLGYHKIRTSEQEEKWINTSRNNLLFLIDIKLIEQILPCSYDILIHHPPILNKLEICNLLLAAHDMIFEQGK